MIPPKVEESLLALTRALEAGHTTSGLLVGYWASRGRDPDVELHTDVRAASDNLDNNLPGLTRSKNGSASLCDLFTRSEGSTLLIWCAANVERSDVKMAALLAAAISRPEHASDAREIARKRIVQGPLEDALSCAPLLGTGDQLSLPENIEAQA